jgi:uncharacterized coiled-coil protein SlyX
MTISPPEVPAEAAQRRVVELEARIAEQAVFIRLLKRNGSAVLTRVGQDVLKDLRRSLQAARKEMTNKEMTNQAAANAKAAHGESGG